MHPLGPLGQYARQYTVFIFKKYYTIVPRPPARYSTTFNYCAKHLPKYYCESMSASKISIHYMQATNNLARLASRMAATSLFSKSFDQIAAP